MKDNKDFSILKNFKGFFQVHRKAIIFLILVNISMGIIDSLFPLLNRYAVDNYLMENRIDGLELFGLLYFGMILLLSYLVYSFIKNTGSLKNNLSYEIRMACFDKLQDLSLDYYDTNATGAIMSRLTSDINRFADVIAWGLVDIVWGITMMIAVAIAMLRLNKTLALILILMIPLIVFSSRYFRKKILERQRKVRKINSQLTASYNEGIEGAITSKAMSRESLNLEEFSHISSTMAEESIRAVAMSSIYIPLIIFIGGIATSNVLVRGGNYVLQGSISFGTLLAFISYSGQFFQPVNQLANIFSEFQTARASAERIYQLLEEEVDIKDSEKVIEKYGPKGEKNLEEMKGNVEFRNVSFAYKDGEKVLKDFNLKVKAGQTIALVGETGSGKSTIVNILARFYEPSQGQVFIDGKDYKDLPKDYIHRNLGYVLQNPYLFNGSIRDNIAYGNLEASDEEIIRAAKMVNAHDFITSFKDGYDTKVGEGGGLLSQGQKQLISFARALVRDPRLFILDEATSSIDTNTELIIQDAIDSMLENRTAFIIAHRLSTIKNADRIILIRQGQIIEEGSHRELLGKKGYYYALFKKQFIDI